MVALCNRADHYIFSSFYFILGIAPSPHCWTDFDDLYGGTENARPENTVKTAGLENARLENTAPNCRTGKREKRHVWKAKLRTPHVILVVILVWC